MDFRIQFNPMALPSPCFIVDEDLLEKNLIKLQSVEIRTGCRVLMALKGFAMWAVFPQIRNYLSGTATSSLNEARLGREIFDKEVHVYAPAYTQAEFPQLLELADHVVFNSISQWNLFGDQAKNKNGVSCGLRVNPEYSEVEVDLYNPAAPNSRLGTPYSLLKNANLEGIDGLHFHVMCEQNSDVLVRVLAKFETQFKDYLPGLKWVNFGGGHHITRDDYDLDLLCKTINEFQQRYNLQVIIEPGEAIALNTGFLVAEVLDLFHNGVDIAILDVSATAHMPDVLEMPYRPEIIGAAEPNKKAHTYRLGGLTCLAGDIIGDYSFEQPLQIGNRIIFTDMAHYSMVKTTMFNGVNHPAMALKKQGSTTTEIIRQFSYSDFKARLS